MKGTTLLRQSLIDVALSSIRLGINQGMSGNTSARVDGGLLITPTAMRYEEMTPDDIVFVSNDGQVEGQRRPSSEWPMHRSAYDAQPSLNGFVHLHSTYATALSCHRQAIPSFHYMVAMAGSKQIPCTDYFLFGTAELAHAVGQALRGSKACLMANHGMMAGGDDLEMALELAVEVEELAKQYLAAKQLGEPVLLTDAQMDAVLVKFAGYRSV